MKMSLEDHLKRIKEIQQEARISHGNLKYRVFLRQTGAIRNEDGTVTIQADDILKWFHAGNHINHHTEYDTM